ncbi:hypothetical protein [Pseudomonas sp. PD9R]|uniref:hypothetical protein n=1 Tax=Pseudomonas sp. PD9R TaxID=2853534 RepID=UPI001C45FF58|nr:hypothetical protein [Pseudomonas sp. PD9R]MBV6821822.1 hypothetical protein [Pseudomonas sp. PD9R]
MRPTVVIKSVLVMMLLNGAAVFSAQATSFVNETNRMGNSCDALRSQVGVALEETSGSELLTFGNGLGMPALVTDIYFDGEKSAKFSSVIHHAGSTESVNVSSCDGLMAAVSDDQAMVNLIGQDTGLTGVSNQPKAVPLSAVAWLFSSALFGFVVVANRRKV